MPVSMCLQAAVVHDFLLKQNFVLHEILVDYLEQNIEQNSKNPKSWKKTTQNQNSKTKTAKTFLPFRGLKRDSLSGWGSKRFAGLAFLGFAKVW